MGLVTKATDPLGNAKTGFYDPAAGSATSNMLTKSNSGIAGDAGSLYYQYDDLQRLTHAYAMSGGTPVDYVYREYDVDGRVTKMAPGAGAPYNCVWQHDPTTGRLTHRTFGWLSAFSSPLAGVDFSYDRPGRLTKMDKGLVRWEYQYRAAAPYEMTAVRATNDYGLTKTTSRAIDAFGRTVTKTLGNGVTTAYQYDDSGALTRMAHAGLDGGGRSLAYAYEYDKAGNRTKVALADSAGTMSSDTAYTYDALNRLTNEMRTGGSANFTKSYYYDSVGNRTFLLEFAGPPGPPVVTSYAYNAGEQLTALTKSYNGVVSENRTYQYDAAGQMTRVADTAAAVTKTFSWDHLGRMTHADVNNGGVTKTVDYANNPAGKRFMRVAGGVTKAWTYQGDNIASVESTTSPTLHSVYSGSGLGGVAERDDVDTAGGGSTTSRFYLYNHRGDVIGVCDASGNLTSAYDYDAYGAVSQSAQSGGGSAPTDDILFTGKDLDPDTGLYYFNARWYDSESGRYVSTTPLPADAEEPYAFCGNNPVTFVDRNGLAKDYPDWYNPADIWRYGFWRAHSKGVGTLAVGGSIAGSAAFPIGPFGVGPRLGFHDEIFVNVSRFGWIPYPSGLDGGFYRSRGVGAQVAGGGSLSVTLNAAWTNCPTADMKSWEGKFVGYDISAPGVTLGGFTNAPFADNPWYGVQGGRSIGAVGLDIYVDDYTQIDQQ